MKTMKIEDIMTKEVKIQKNTRENCGPKLLLRLALLLCLVMGGVNGAWGADPDLSQYTLVKTMDFSTSTYSGNTAITVGSTNVGAIAYNAGNNNWPNNMNVTAPTALVGYLALQGVSTLTDGNFSRNGWRLQPTSGGLYSTGGDRTGIVYDATNGLQNGYLVVFECTVNASTVIRLTGSDGTTPTGDFSFSLSSDTKSYYCTINKANGMVGFDGLKDKGYIKSIKIYKPNNALVNYKVKYVDESGNEIKTASTYSATSGTSIVLTATDKSPIYYGGNKYLYTSDDSSGKTVAADGSTVVTVKFRKAATYSYTVKSDLGTTIESGTGFEDDSKTVPFPQYELKDGRLYEADKIDDSKKQYQYTFTLDADNTTKTINYSSRDITNVVYFSEGEKVDGATATSSGNNMKIRSSNGACGYAATDIELITLSPGIYTAKMVGYSNSSAGATYKFNFDGSQYDFVISGSSNWSENTKDFTLTDNSTAKWLTSGDTKNGLDYIYIQKTSSPYTIKFLDSEGNNISGKDDATGMANIGSMVDISGYMSFNVNDVTYTLMRTERPAISMDNDENVIRLYYVAGNSTSTLTTNDASTVSTFSVSGEGTLGENYSDALITVNLGADTERQVAGTVQGKTAMWCVDNAGYTFAYNPSDNAAPTMGTFYKFTPTANGFLTVNMLVDAVNSVMLYCADDDNQKIAAASITADTWFDHRFELKAGKTYYLFAETGLNRSASSRRAPSADAGTYPTLYVSGFSFAKTLKGSKMIEISKLLLKDNTLLSTMNLDRKIPGWRIVFPDKDTEQAKYTEAHSDYVKVFGDELESGIRGQIRFVPDVPDSQKDNITIDRVKVTYGTVNNNTSVNGSYKKTESASNTTVEWTSTDNDGSGNYTWNKDLHEVVFSHASRNAGTYAEIKSVEIFYTYTADTEFNESKGVVALTPYSPDNYEVALDANQAVAQTGFAVSEDANKGYSYAAGFRGTLTNSVSPAGVVTYDGTTVTRTAVGEATVTTTFAETDYFAEATASFTVTVPALYWSTTTCTYPNVFASMRPRWLPTLTNDVKEEGTVTYSSSDTGVADFTAPSDYGSLRVKTAGTTTITATHSNGKTSDYTLNVVNEDKVWDFSTLPANTSFEGNAITNRKLNNEGSSCDIGTGFLEGLAFQNLYAAKAGRENDYWHTDKGGQFLQQVQGGRTWGVLNLEKGDMVQIKYYDNGNSMTLNGTTARVISDDKNIVLYQMLKDGDLSLNVTSKIKICKITIIAFKFTEIEHEMGKTETYTPTVFNTTTHPLRATAPYASSNSAVASIGAETGKITAHAGGTTEITATATDGSVARMTIIVPLEFGWVDTKKVTVSLLDADNNNHVDGFLSEFVNKNGREVKYTPTTVGGNAAWFATKGWEDPWGLTLYGKPRIIKPGTVTLKAEPYYDDALKTHVTDELDSQFDLVITEPAATTGTAQTDSKMYEFNAPGLLTIGGTVSDISEVTMKYGNNTDLAVVVNSGGTTVVKMIDGSGFSHPNLDGGVKIPIGGTYYKFTANAETGTGKLIIFGVFDNPKMYDSSNNEVTLTGAGDSRIVDIESGKTYYLYNKGVGTGDDAGSNVPLLHGYRFVADAKTLTFRNTSPVIAVDLNDGSYTNTAVSTAGLPVTYSLLSGTGVTVDTSTGKVTFTDNHTPRTVVVQATDDTETISYVLQLAKRTWVFNDAAKWTTSKSALTTEGGWKNDQTSSQYGMNGSYTFSRHTTAMDYAPLTTDGTTPLPETQGLLFNKIANNDRLYVAPADYGRTFLAMRASSISIDDVQEGQVVTVNWTGGNSSAVLDMSDTAGANATGNRGGTLQLTVTRTGRVEIYSNPNVSFINSISIGTPIRAVGTLLYPKTVLYKTASEAEVLELSGYTITDEAGLTNLKTAYETPTNYQSSNPGVVKVDPETGQLTAVGVGTAVITASAEAKNGHTHQSGVTLVATIEVVDDKATRIRTISIADLLYDTSTTVTGTDLNRHIPGFDLTYSGAASSSAANTVVLAGADGTLTITPRRSGSDAVTITRAMVTVSDVTGTAQWQVNDGTAAAVTKGGIDCTSLTKESLTLKAVDGSVSLTSLKLYYKCSVEAKADNCLDETKVAPVFKFERQHVMRIPGDGRTFTQTPTQDVTDNFHSFQLSYTYASSAVTTATINADGTGGLLIASGQSTITATFHETDYFAASHASYTVDNTLQPGETYLSDTGEDITMTSGQKIHIEGSATAAGTALSLSGTADPNLTTLTYGTARQRLNTVANAGGTVTLKNATETPITLYSLHVITSKLRSWLYYEGQDENYKEQVHFVGFTTGAVKGYRILDIGDPDNPIDLTSAYQPSGSYTKTDASAVLGTVNTITGTADAMKAGTATISHPLTKRDVTGLADGYNDNLTVQSTIRVLNFGDGNPVEWNFMGTVENKANVLGEGWTYDERGFHYGYFADYMPMLNYDASADKQTVKDDQHGMLLKDEYRWYPDRGLRANLSQARASIKFPVKAGMEIDVYAATSSANVSHSISNVTDVTGTPTSTLYIEQDGYNNPVHNYFIAQSDGVVEIFATDKVGMYIKSITLQVPEIHFTDEIVTQSTSGDNGDNLITNATTNIPAASLKYLTYTISSPKNLDGTDVGASTLATINNTEGSATKGQLTITGNEGWFRVDVENTNPAPTALEPKHGSYLVYIVNFKFVPNKETLNLDKHNGEDYYSERPVGYDKVVTPINYSYAAPAEGQAARAMIGQSTGVTPAETTYELTVYSLGSLILQATTGRITAKCEITVTGNAFGEVAPVLSEQDIAKLPKDESNKAIYKNALPSKFVGRGTNTIQLSKSGDITSLPAATIDGDSLVLTGVNGIGHGAIRCVVTNDNGTSGVTSDDMTAQFVLTLAYPASEKKKWDFYRMKHGGSGNNDGFYALSTNSHGDLIGSYTIAGPVSDYEIKSHDNTWTTTATWKKIAKKGKDNPRWAYNSSVHRNNAFIIEETAGLQIETPTASFYVDNNSCSGQSDAGYTHIGVHSHSTITIPKLKNGDFISLNLSRVIPNKGAIIEAQNVTDLAGKPVTDAFTITRSQTDYGARDGDGARIIPGYYTFIAHKAGAGQDDEFDVSFSLADEGHLDVLAVEIYSPGERNSGYGTDPANGYDYTMLPVKLGDSTVPPVTLLKESAQTMVYDLTFCHPLWSTSVGPAQYVVRETGSTLDAQMENVGWYSDGGAHYYNGRITVGEGYGRIKVRMENFTEDLKYLVGYTPDYSLTVGLPPHQDYPYTWNFENISGGAVKGRSNNAYNSITADHHTWQGLGYETYQLDTRTTGGSLYVPGATLTTTDRNLGQKGTVSELNAAGQGCDEFNGLGFNGQIAFKVAQQGSTANDAPTGDWTRGDDEDGLLTFTMKGSDATVTIETKDGKNVTTVTWPAAGEDGYWEAGDGKIKFGSAGKRILVDNADRAPNGAAYQMDGGNSKHLLLHPQRPLQEGDVITLKGYSTGSVLQSGFSFYAAANDDGANALHTVNWTTNTDKKQTITYTVQQGDGLAGREEVYLFRAMKKYTVFLTEVTITGDDETKPASYGYGRQLVCNGDVTVTIPDLVEGHYVYIKASAAPKTVPASLTAAVTADGLDALPYDDTKKVGVYKYKVTTAGNADVTFADGTRVYRIGVTDIMKPMKRVGNGDAWATESRDHAIDYTETGQFTVNNITANTVTATQYALQRVTVKMNDVDAAAIAAGETPPAMPAETGMVLRMKLKYTTDDEKSKDVKMTDSEATDATTAAVANFAKAKGSNSVPLFYPPYSTPILAATAVGFGGTQGNLMKENVTEQTFASETETINGTDYTPFIFTERYMKWTKVTADGQSKISTDNFTDSGDLPVFVRLHYYSGSEFTTYPDGGLTSNTLGANKAYMLIRSGNVPDALWKDDASTARPYIGIEGISDMDEYDEGGTTADRLPRRGTYDLRGQRVDDSMPLRPGVYIRDGRKIVVK